MSESSKIHDETAAGWNIVAESKYRNEIEEHIELLSSGGNNLLEPEAEILLPVIQGLDIVQLQCSHGLDALGLLNAGARTVTGFDISNEMISQAKAKADKLELDNASFVCSDVLRISGDYDESADLVYTGRGSLIWIMDIAAWSEAVARILRPGGQLFIYEGHPLKSLWNRDSAELELLENADYFGNEAKEHEGFPSAHVENVVGGVRPKLLERQWRPGEVMEALISAGLTITKFQEYPHLFWNQFPQWNPGLSLRLPNSYVLMARK